MVKSSFNIVNLIKKKRDGLALTESEIQFIVNGYTHDEFPDYQMSAFLMASFLNGMNKDEASSLTNAMLNSGIIVDLSAISGTKVDKHSTGGVGDKVSLILAPIVASAGVPVPMISGRGLGHSGGTLDKLESINGFKVDLNLDRYKQVLDKHNLVLIGQTKEIAPADKKIYALRDVTSTVEFIPFIASSIMSKKLAEGIDALVLDVKYGSGAFMKTNEQAIELAQTLVSIGESFGKHTIAYITNMNQPLGKTIGNWLETKESIELLQKQDDIDLMKITHLLSGTMIYLGGKAVSVEEGIEISKNQIINGEAFQKFKDIVIEQGGEIGIIDNPDSYTVSQYEVEWKATSTGYLSRLDAYELALASLELGAGRKSITDTIDYTAGIVLNKKVGDFIKAGETIFTAYTNKAEALDTAAPHFDSAVEISNEIPKPELLVTHVIDRQGLRAFEL